MDLRQADLHNVSFYRTRLHKTNVSGATIDTSVFAEVDLRHVIGLDELVHRAPSEIGISTILFSKGEISEVFLRGAGVPDEFIVYARSLVQRPIEFYSCFISYSSGDQDFSERLHSDLQGKNVRCWFDREDMKIGDKIRTRIDESIRLHDKLLLVLSEHSVTSAWVEQEVETALDRENRHGKTILFPIRLDNAVMEIETGWPALVRNTRHIGDFTRWKDHDAYQAAFERLLRDLKAEGG